jgi:hypothetical protein
MACRRSQVRSLYPPLHKALRNKELRKAFFMPPKICLLYGEDPVNAETPGVARTDLVRMAIDRGKNPLALYAHLSQQITAAGIYRLYREIELPTLAPVLAMKLSGMSCPMTCRCFCPCMTACCSACPRRPSRTPERSSGP